nr:protein C13A10.3 [imported] - Caenorhabditis elegans [Caenorhabditis elegans]
MEFLILKKSLAFQLYDRKKQVILKFLVNANDSSGVSSCTTSDSQNPTHRVQSAFHPRHPDELLLEIGDAVHVDRTADDHWSYGTNLRTGQSGIFPASIVCEIDLVEEICLGALPTNATKILSGDRDTFYLTMLASIEVAHHKGNDVLTQAMNKVLSMYKNSEEIIVPQTVLMEISFRGIHVIDKRRKNIFRIYHETPVAATFRLPRVHVQKYDTADCRGYWVRYSGDVLSNDLMMNIWLLLTPRKIFIWNNFFLILKSICHPPDLAIFVIRFFPFIMNFFLSKKSFFGRIRLKRGKAEVFLNFEYQIQIFCVILL